MGLPALFQAGVVVDVHPGEHGDFFAAQSGHLAAAGIEHARVSTVVGDVSKEDTPVRSVAAAIDRFGGMDILVSNAGRSVNKPITETTAARVPSGEGRPRWRRVKHTGPGRSGPHSLGFVCPDGDLDAVAGPDLS